MEINEVPRITCEELKQLIDNGEKVVLIDTRRNSGYSAEHIKGAVNIYYEPSVYQMERELMLSSLPADKLLVFYCDCIDDSESAIMALELINLGYDVDNVRALSVGFLRWKELDYPTESV
jgi:rhodanese-related sulfurtransferase